MIIDKTIIKNEAFLKVMSFFPVRSMGAAAKGEKFKTVNYKRKEKT